MLVIAHFSSNGNAIFSLAPADVVESFTEAFPDLFFCLHTQQDLEDYTGQNLDIFVYLTC